jgi:hypothetical protein
MKTYGSLVPTVTEGPVVEFVTTVVKKLYEGIPVTFLLTLVRF